jgi:hypothetical protein
MTSMVAAVNLATIELLGTASAPQRSARARA